MAAHFWHQSDRISPDSEDAFTQEEINEIIELVRESSFLDDESGMTIDERMTEVFGGDEPEWSGFQNSEGICCVNCGGVMTDSNSSMGVVIQFEIAEDMESFVFSGMLIDGVEQPEGLILQFEEQFASNVWENYDEYEDLQIDDDGYDPRERFASSGYAEWEKNALWDEWDEDSEEDEDDCCCHEHHHEHHHGHCDCGGEHDMYDDEDEEDEVPDWGEDAAERFWYGTDDDEY